ncbi:MAG: hypothetical protein ACR2RV_05870, partial [Verrucomicrobiales bacterium]
HRRCEVIACGAIGLLFVLAGAPPPSLGKDSGASSEGSSPAPVESAPATLSKECAESDCTTACAAESGAAVQESDCDGSVPTGTASDKGGGTCVDACCPSIQAEEDGGWRLEIPLASVLTTLGGLFLIVTHIGNLCRCPIC